MKFRRKKREKLDITLISMIDVLFVLLLFFMVSTTFNRHTEVKINLPQAEGSDVEGQPETVSLDIDAVGTYFLKDDEGLPRAVANQTAEGLKQALGKLAEEAKALPFVINADENTPTKAVVTALDIATQVGFTHATFTTVAPKGQQ
ncbi:MAG: biopolymer transporter ExbD [Methylococcales bacterium]|nr:biopolymer transporter ExbD [Methylococcales bacterium]